MEMIINFMLLAASGAATFYCFILSRKLEALKSTEKGLGATIATMSHTVEQARTTVAMAKETSAESIAELSPLVEETKEILPQLSEMIDVISELAEIAIRDVNDASGKASAALDERLAKARELQEKLDQQIDFFLVDDPDPDGPGTRHVPEEQEGNVAFLDEDDAPTTPKRRRQSKVSAALMTARNQQKMKKLAG
ncbi:DUF6468 domain-containing protein [Hyphococcus flavus]|uniref:DUF6468 domain-containing protein n=1 Tax=Hyphococcus flavus TaxID=1866326 RepID=A0AAE9ZED4_9PROT|nr:DUF6468 domain-containing protein [Hyphococcus flavus]WDI31537.1 DUF6468 domain-containing protein [Hyphococcus flavus]